MKKSLFCFSALAAMTLTMGALMALDGQTFYQADATEQRTLIVNDNFNDSALGNSFDHKKWNSTSESIKQSVVEDTYFYNDGSSVNLCTECLFYGTREVKTFEYIQFDLYFFGSGDEWISLKFYKNPITVTNISNPTTAYEGPIGIRSYGIIPFGDTSSATGHPLYASITDSPADYSGNSFEWALGAGHVNAKDKWITVRIEPTNSSETKIYIFNKGEAKDSEKALTFALNSDGQNVYDYKTCQFGFQCSNECRYAIDNLEYKEAGVATPFLEEYISYHDDDVAYPLGYVRKYDARYEITGLSTLDIFAGAHNGDRIIANTQLKKDETIAQDVSVIDAKFKLRFLDAATDEESFGFVFGLPESNGLLTAAGGVLQLHKNKVTLKVFGDGAQISDDAQNTTSFGATLIDQLTSEAGLNFAVRLTKSGIFSLLRMKDDGSYVVVKNFPAGADITRYHGYAGFMAMSDIAHNISIDDVLIYNCQYYVPVTKSVTHNFSNSYFGNPGYEDFYIPSSMDGKIEVNDGKLTYTACSDTAFFGSAHQYDAFVLDYKLCSVLVGPEKDSKEYTSPQKWIGLDLSRKVPTLSYYGSYATLLFEINPLPTSEYVYLQLFVHPDYNSPLDKDISVFTYRKGIPCSMFRKLHYTSAGSPADIKEEDYVCIRWVSDGSSISLYLKTNGETEYTLYGTFSNVELNGYFALCNTGFTFLQYDDFSMANTSPIYTCADNEVPETITTTETITIYDIPDVDVNLQDEIAINASGMERILLITTIAAGVVAVGLAVTFIIFLKKKKAK